MTFVESPTAASNDSISRSAAINIVKKYLRINKDLFDAIEYELGNLPSTQSEIVRCKECRFYTPIKRTDRWWCRCDEGLWQSNENDFCSKAERRTDG